MVTPDVSGFFSLSPVVVGCRHVLVLALDYVLDFRSTLLTEVWCLVFFKSGVEASEGFSNVSVATVEGDVHPLGWCCL